MSAFSLDVQRRLKALKGLRHMHAFLYIKYVKSHDLE